MTEQLFAAIRRGKVKPGMANEFAKRVKAGALPAMQKIVGFKGYYLVAAATAKSYARPVSVPGPTSLHFLFRPPVRQFNAILSQPQSFR